MALIIPLRHHTPQFGRDCFLAENATIIGDVVMGDECSVWFNTVLRGDVNSIRIGNRVNTHYIKNRLSKSATMCLSATT